MKQWAPHEYLPTRRRKKKDNTLYIGPPVVLSLGFIFFIFLGMLLLKLPIATTSPISWVQSLFTATSAVTVTGLVVVDTGTQFTFFGQAVIALLMQLGGLGLMTFSVVTLIALGTKMSVVYQVAAKEAFGQTNLQTLYDIAKSVIIFALIIELVGFLLLWTCWLDEMPFWEGAWQSFFYTISAFNNAGFGLKSDSLSQWVADPAVNFIISGLFITGGLGFTVWRELYIHRAWNKLSVYAKLMIAGTIGINAVAILAIYLIEYNNPETLGNLSELGKWLGAYFQAVTTRTAGFNSVPIHELENASSTIMLLLMFIGGGSLSTASGIKLVTFIVLVLAAYRFLRRDGQLNVMGRELNRRTVRKAFALVVISVAFNWVAIFILSITEKADFLDIVFEATSALGTVGLSRGITATLSPVGEVVLMFLMFLGRLGPLTLAYILASPKTSMLRYPEVRMPIG